MLENRWGSLAAGALAALAIGFICGKLRTPAPAPPAIAGALLVLCTSLGFVLGSGQLKSWEAAFFGSSSAETTK